MRFFLMALLAFGFATTNSLCAETKNAKDFKGSKPKATNDPVYIEYLKVLTMDDAAEKEIDKWIKEADKSDREGTGLLSATLPQRVEERLKPVRAAYEDFLTKHPNHAEARLAFGSFLMDNHDEDAGVEQMEKAREIDPTNPAAWNNLANHYGHRGPVQKAFGYYEKAMELDPEEPVYPWNFATTVYLFRPDAREHYKITEQQVFDRAMELYQKAMKLDPTNLVLAVDLAQSYYGIKPMRTNDALLSWTNALNLARTTDERQGIFLHLARVELNTGHWEEARRHLGYVTNSEMIELKKRLERNWIEKRNKALGVTNSASVYADPAASKASDLR
jgi:tetratricopeptide (TPR) repeat protein